MTQKIVRIIMMGESGVGKTTLINMIGQCVENQTLGTLDEVQQNGLQISAPCAFSIVDANNEEHNIQLGEDPNEIAIPGGSSTKKPRAYTFNVPSLNMVLNVVDTPGLASSGGIQQDIQNLQEILQTIAKYKQLYAICLLFKPTNPRSTVIFEHVITHMADNLKPFLNNIIFIFTNTRGSLFKPGNTYEALKSVLQRIRAPVDLSLRRNNMYCIDNEAFRYLAALQHGVSFPDDDVDVYRNSFDRSKAEIYRMLEYINSHMSPVLLQDPLTINDSDRIIKLLTAPLHLLVVSLENAIVSIDEYEKSLKQADLNVANFTGNLFKIEHKEIVKKTEESVTKKGITPSVGAEAGFITSLASITAKLELSYDSTITKKESKDFVENKVMDREVLPLINKYVDDKKAIVEAKNVKEQIRRELINEINTAIDAIAKFNKFQQQTNYLPYDDPFISVLDKARKLAMVDNNIVVAEEYGKLLKKYEIIKKDLKTVDMQEIVDLMNQLCTLKHYGRSFMELTNSDLISLIPYNTAHNNNKYF